MFVKVMFIGLQMNGKITNNNYLLLGWLAQIETIIMDIGSI